MLFEKSSQSERGQAIVIVAGAIVVLLAFLGLAVDGGTVYANRRRTQNASDAASLAGTRLLAEAICGDPSIDDTAIAQAVNSYAEKNGVDDSNGVAGDEINSNVTAYYVHFANNDVIQYDPPELVGDGDGIPTGASGIQTTTAITRSTYFLGLVGQPSGTASSVATAITGPLLTTGGGLTPIGIPIQVVQDLNPEDPFSVNMGASCSGEDDCAVTYIDDSGANSIEHRGWVNLCFMWNQSEASSWPRAPRPGDCEHGNGNIGVSSLMDWLSDPPQVTLYADCAWDEGCRHGDYIHGKPGTSWGALQTNCSSIVDQTIYAPVFDHFEADWDNITNPKPDVYPSQGGGGFYHIVGFTAVKVTSCQHGAGGQHTINMELVELITGEGQVFPTSGSGYGEPGACLYNLQVVNLWE